MSSEMAKPYQELVSIFAKKPDIEYLGFVGQTTSVGTIQPCHCTMLYKRIVVIVC